MKMIKNIKMFLRETRKYKPISPQVNQAWKYFWQWRKTLDKHKTSIDYQLPWFTFNAIDFLNKNVKPGMQVFEFGGGGSTLYFLNKNSVVNTVEHNAEWFNLLKKTIAPRSYYTKWTGYHIKPEIGLIVEALSPSNPTHYLSTDEQFKNHNFKKYATKIAEYENNFFDVVLVDGRARPSCIVESIKKVKIGGYLIVDNTEREYYLKETNALLDQEYTLVLNSYGPVPYTANWFTQTTIWKRK